MSTRSSSKKTINLEKPSNKVSKKTGTSKVENFHHQKSSRQRSSSRRNAFYKKFKGYQDLEIYEEEKNGPKNQNHKGMDNHINSSEYSNSSLKRQQSNSEIVYIKIGIYRLGKRHKKKKKASEIFDDHNKGTLSRKDDVHLTINLDPDLKKDDQWEQVSIIYAFEKLLKIPIYNLKISGGKVHK